MPPYRTITSNNKQDFLANLDSAIISPSKPVQKFKYWAFGPKEVSGDLISSLRSAVDYLNYSLRLQGSTGALEQGEAV